MPDPENTQPHIITIIYDDYNQYYTAVEKILCMECADIASALFFSHCLPLHFQFELPFNGL